MTKVKVPSTIQHHETVRKWLRENVMKGVVDEITAEGIYREWLKRRKEFTRGAVK